MTASTVNGVAVVADEPTRAPINARGGKAIFWPRVRTLTLADGSTTYGCLHCDYVNANLLSIRPHLKKHANDPKPRKAKCAAKVRRPHPLVAALAAERKRQGWSVREIAARIGWSVTAVGDWERGSRDPGISGVVDYACALGLELTLSWSQSQPAMSGQGALFERAS